MAKWTGEFEQQNNKFSQIEMTLPNKDAVNKINRTFLYYFLFFYCY